MKKFSKLFAVLMVAAMLCVAMVIPASAKAQVKTGYFGKGYTTDWIYVYSTQNKDGSYKNPKIKICTFNEKGKRSNAMVDVQIVGCTTRLSNPKNRVSTPAYLKLGDIVMQGTGKKYERCYKIKISASSTGNWNNYKKCVMWSVDATSNCHF